MANSAPTWNEGAKSRRSVRKFLIYPQFQLPLIIFNLSSLFLSLLVFWVSSQRVISALEPAAKLSGVEIEFFRKYLAYQSRTMNIMFLCSGLATLLITGAATLIISHKIAGPMVALRHFFNKIKDGVEPMPRLKFRDFDFLQDIPPLINDALESLTQRMNSRKRA